MESIDDNYIWQRRIHHGIRHQKGTVPFPESVEIGLEFNAALEREEKLDLSLLTNGVMLELCDFAKTVTKSGKYFMFEMLEFNFDLGMDTNNEMQCYDYATRVHSKIKTLREQIKLRPSRWREAFVLPDRNTVRGSSESEVSGRYYPKRNKILDSSVLTDGSKKSQTPNNQCNAAAKGSFLIKKPGGVRIKDNAYPFCKELGVTLAVQSNGGTPKQKLHPNLITNGVMIELLDFSRVLCGAQTQMVNDLVKQNFGYELDKLQFRLQLAKLMEKKYACLTGESRDSFRKEPFQLQTSERKTRTYKRRNINDLELERLTIATKRRGTLRHANSDAKEIWHENEQSYMCPVDFETETQSSTPARQETKLDIALNVKQEEEEVFISPAQPRTNSHNARWFNYHQTQKSVSDLFSEDRNNNLNVKTPKQKLWLRRVTRSKQILSSSRVNDIFAGCRDIGLDFNVGSGNKKNLDLQLLTNRVLWEVYKFATAMTKSMRSFLFDILNNNFNLTLQDELHERNFLHYIMTKEKNLLNNPARNNTEFLSCTFQFPEVYNMVDVTSDFKTEEKVKTEQETDWDSSQETDVERHPFCKRFGLNLWSTEERPAGTKLDLSVLTTGAVLETFTLIRELCGTAREVVNDVLEHNFDLELQSGSTEAGQVIHRWYAMQKSFFRKQNSSARINQWLNETVYSTEPQASNQSRGGLNVEFQKEAFKGSPQQVKTIEDYHICKGIGLDLDIRSKSEPKTKLDLRVLTRRVVFELHRYVEGNCKRFVPALYEILDYNFDLSSQNHRKVEFAWSIASQVIAMAGKHSRKGSYLDKVFELPFEVAEFSSVICKEEQEDFNELDPDDSDEIVFVRELKPVDIEVEIY